jgi:small subunit ribosomal protein S6
MSNRTYELIYVLKPDAAESEVADMHKQVADIVERMGGTIDKTENALPWGRRKLAYEINRHREGVYVLELINGPAAMVTELDRRLRVIDTVLRHLVIRVDEDLAAAGRAQTRRKEAMAARRVRRGLPPEPTEGERKQREARDEDEDDLEGGLEPAFRGGER